MRFYRWTWDQIMNLPLKAFWTCLKGKRRIQAQDNLQQLRLNRASLAEAEKKDVDGYIDDQLKILGTVVVEKAVRDPDALAKLKQLGG